MFISHESPVDRYTDSVCWLLKAEDTTASQRKLISQGITIVAPIRAADRFPFERNARLLAQAREGFHSFVPAAHLTICGVCEFEESRLSDARFASLQSIAENVVKRMFSQRSSWRVALHGIVPGGESKQRGSAIVWALARDQAEALRAIQAGVKAALEEELKKLDWEHHIEWLPGHKLTLGYFAGEDFALTEKLASTLQYLYDARTEILVDHVQAVQFYRKSLIDSTVLESVPLAAAAADRSQTKATFTKVQTESKWPPCEGWSYLFVPAEQQTNETACVPGSRQITYQPWKSKTAGLFRTFPKTLAKLGLDNPDNAFALHATPCLSYHVTLLDGQGVYNLDDVPPRFRGSLEETLLGLPESAARPPGYIDATAFDSAVSNKTIRFRFKRLGVWADALVAVLEPADVESEEICARLLQRRLEVRKQFKDLGLPVPREDVTLHCTLGYFSHRSGRALAKELESDWNEAFLREADGETVEFAGVRPYWFPDMTRFVRAEDSSPKG